MGPPRTGRISRGRGCAAGAIAGLAIASAAAAAGAAAAPEGAVKAAPGVVVEFAERPAGNILYLEEKGGMVSSIAPPAADARRTAAPARERALAPVRAEPATGKAPAKARASLAPRR